MLKPVFLRDSSLLGESTCLGSIAAFALLLVHAVVSRHVPSMLDASEGSLLALYGFWVSGAPSAWYFLFGQWGFLLMGIPMILLVWPRTRKATAWAFAIVVELAIASLTALEIVLAYTFAPLVGLLCVPLAVPLGLVLARWHRLSLTGMAALVVAMGITFTSLASPQGDDLSGLWRVWWLLPLTAAAVFGIRWRPAVRPVRSKARFVGMWGLGATMLATTALTAMSVAQMVDHEPPTHRVLATPAYDVQLAGNPPYLLWTDKKAVRFLQDPGGNPSDAGRLDGAPSPHQIWPSIRGGFFVQARGAAAWWRDPSPSHPLSPQPDARHAVPTTPAGEAMPGALAEDPFSRRRLVISEWFSTYVITDIDSGRILDQGRLGSSVYPYMTALFDPRTRLVYVSSFMGDGALHVLDLATLQLKRTIPGLYLFGMTIDPDRNLLWAARPFLGDVVALGLDDFLIRHRVPTEWGIRDVARDPATGDIYTCSFLRGDMFRIDPTDMTAKRFGRCGWYCRYMHVDPMTHALWIASGEGICSVTLPADPPGGSAAPRASGLEQPHESGPEQAGGAGVLR